MGRRFKDRLSVPPAVQIVFQGVDLCLYLSGSWYCALHEELVPASNKNKNNYNKIRGLALVNTFYTDTVFECECFNLGHQQSSVEEEWGGLLPGIDD